MSGSELGRVTRRGFLSISGLALGTAALSACGSKNSSSASASASGSAGTMRGIGNGGAVGKGRSGQAADTLFMFGLQWGPPTNFSPLSATAAWPAATNTDQFIYETALRWNILTGEILPGLAKSYTVDSTKSITLTMQDAAKFTDGQACTAEDVAYTFQLAQLDGSLSYSAIWQDVDSIAAPDQQTCIFTINQDRRNVSVVLMWITQVYILPKHIWQQVAQTNNNRFSAYQTTTPIGTGPFPLHKADPTQVSMKLNQAYWGKDFYGGLPAFSLITHPIYASDKDSYAHFQNGEIDVMQAFVPRIWTMWQAGRPVGTYLKQSPYYVPGSMPMLLINTTKPGLDNVAVRRAMAHAVNYSDISKTAMSGYSALAKASLILPAGPESRYFDQSEAEGDNGWSYDPKKAEQILVGAGAKKGRDGVYVLNGTRLGPWTLITPTGWTDWNAALQIVAANFRAIGIDASTTFPQQADVITDVQKGSFDMACWHVSGVTPASPWQRFADIMTNVDLMPVGTPTYHNYGRWKNSEVNALLTTAGSAQGDAAKKAAYTALDDLFRANVPAFALMYRPDEFFEYNASNFYNWPDETNSYAPPMFRGAGNTWMYKLKKISA